jgi:hypothetical protein
MAYRGQKRTAEVDDDILGDHHHHHRHHLKPKVPVIPDLRFEYSYLRNIRPYVHVERLGGLSSVSAQQQHRHLSTEDLLSDYEKVEFSGKAEKRDDAQEPQHSVAVQNPSTGPKEIVRVEWNKVIWVTTRDQVISPLLQGALWYVVCFCSRLSRS